MKKIFINVILLLTPVALLADQPKKWQMGFQEPASQSMRDIVWFHNYMLVPIIVAISAFVLFLMLYAMVKFRASRNPNPSKRTHNVLVEVVWTLVPCLILIVMAVPSFKVLYSQDEIPKADVTIKAIGYQWYWGYEYPDENIIFDSYMIEENDLKEGQPRLLAVDNEVIVPVNKVVKVLITANDVLHAWALPAFGVKRDAMPGRVNETWFKAERTGTFYGQCSELCGIKHAFMPITVRVVSEQEYLDWLEEAKIKFAKDDEGSRIQDILEYKDPQKPSYPTEKNNSLLSILIQCSSNPGDIVMDCFCGSGSTLNEASKLDRKFIGIDQSSMAIEVTTKRLGLNSNSSSN